MSRDQDQQVILRLADGWLRSHKVSESWRIINTLRHELVRTLKLMESKK